MKDDSRRSQGPNAPIGVCPVPKQSGAAITCLDEARSTAESKLARDEYSAVFDRVFARVCAHERALAHEQMEAPALLDKLVSQPCARRKLLVRNSRRFHTLTLGRKLIHHSHRLGFKDPAEGQGFAELATDIAERLDPETYGPGAVEDLRGAAWAQMGNARRILGEFHKAEEAFAIAEFFLERGSGDPLEQAHLANLRASLRRAQRHFEESLALLDEAVQVYHSLDDPHMVGRTLIKKGSVLGLSGDLAGAISILCDGLKMIDQAAHPHLALVGHHNLVGLLADTGRYLEAKGMLGKLRKLHRRFQDPISNLRLLWLEGRIDKGLGRLTQAEAALDGALNGFLAHNIGYNAAMVAMDLASMYAMQARYTEMRALASAMLPIFQAQDVHREAMAALLLFRQAVQKDTVSFRFIQEVREYLSQAQHNPQLRFLSQTLAP